MECGENASVKAGFEARTVVAAFGSAVTLGLGLAGAGVVGTAAAAQDGGVTTEVQVNGVATDAGASLSAPIAQTQTQVVGTFAFTQGEVTPIDRIARAMGMADVYLCGSQPVSARGSSVIEGATASWQVSLDGDVAHPLVLDGANLRAGSSETIVMGCSCTGNPIDGLASVNAEVTGVAMAALLRRAAPLEGANTVVFISTDGYEIALPLRYLDQHYCPLVFEVNGEDIANSMGGFNQLWLSSTPASYYVRDVVSIRVETRDEVPAEPSAAVCDQTAVQAVAVIAG